MTVFRLVAVVVLLGLMSGACSRPQTDGVSTVGSSAEGQPVPPDVDMSLHAVPLEDIYFDTFDGGAVRLSDSTRELRLRLLDAIPPIDEPIYGPRVDGDWLDEDDLVLGYVSGDAAYAYPFKILNFHEIVNDVIDGVPVLISYCPLCRSAIVFDRRVDDLVLSFGNTSALYESDLVMVDRQTGSYWWQVAGRAIVGPLTDTGLDVRPSVVATWADWTSTHPETLVLTRETGYERPYEVDSFANYSESVDAGRFAFPVDEDSLDPRLDPAELVVGVSIDDVVRVYPVDGKDSVINDVLGETPVVVFRTGGGAAVFSPILDGQTLRFSLDGEAHLVDDKTGSVWGVDGLAVSGPLAGRMLDQIATRTTFWFAFVGAFPNAQIYGQG